MTEPENTATESATSKVLYIRCPEWLHARLMAEAERMQVSLQKLVVEMLTVAMQPDATQEEPTECSS